MRIGSRPAAGGSGPREYVRVSATAEDFGAGVGAALRNLGGSVQQFGLSQIQLNEQVKEREKKNTRAINDIEYIKWQGQRTREVLDMRGNVEPGARGLTNAAYEQLNGSFDQWLQERNITDPQEQRYYRERATSFMESQATDLFVFEFNETNRYIEQGIKDTLDDSLPIVRGDPSKFEEEFNKLADIVDQSDLPPLQKEALTELLYNALGGATYQAEVEAALADQRPVREADGSDVVAAGLSAPARGFLNAIAGPESGGKYNARYPGSTFEGYADHPRIREVIQSGPNKGKTSDAAGRYQFLSSTWDALVKEMNAKGHNITDFSPQNQDRVALYYAKKTYAGMTGRDLEQDIATGDRALVKEIRKMLVHKWEGLGNISDDAFANVVLGGRGLSGGGTGRSEAPDIWSDPRFADLPYNQRVELELAAGKAAALQREQEAAAQKAQEQALLDRLDEMIASGSEGVLEYASTILPNIADAGRRAEVYEKTARERELQQDLFELSGRIAAGQPLTADDQETFDELSKRTGVLEGIQQADPPSAARVIRSFAQSGLFPSQILDITQAQLANPQTQMFAARMLAGLWEANPQRFEQLGGSPEQASMFSTMLNSAANPEQGIRQYQELMASTSEDMRGKLRKEADTFLEERSMDSIRRDFQPFLNRWTPFLESLGLGNRVKNAEDMFTSAFFLQKYNDTFRTLYVMHGGDEARARESTVDLLSKEFSPSPTTGHIMYAPPQSMGVPPIEGSFDWIGDHVRELMPEADLPEDFTPYIVGDLQTRAEAMEGKPPSYHIGYIDEASGTYRYLGRFPVYLTPERQFKHDAERQLRAEEARLSAIEQDRRRLLTESDYGMGVQPSNADAVALERLDTEARATQSRLEALRADMEEAEPFSTIEGYEAESRRLREEIQQLQRTGAGSTAEGRKQISDLMRQLFALKRP